MEDIARRSKGMRRHIRLEKASIRRKLGMTPEADAGITEFMAKFFIPRAAKSTEAIPVAAKALRATAIKSKKNKK